MASRQERRLIKMDEYKASKKANRQLKNSVMTKDNVMVIEFHDASGDGKVTEFFANPNEPDSPKIYSTSGYKVFAIYDNKSKAIAQYDHNLNSTDLTCLENRNGHFLCTVSKNEYNAFFWMCYQVGSFLDEKGIVSIQDGRECTEEESALLNEVYPEYLTNAF